MTHIQNWEDKIKHTHTKTYKKRTKNTFEEKYDKI